jgi:hypothetical protein
MRTFWRGYADKTSLLTPRVFRPFKRWDGKVLRYAESHMLWQFVMQGTPRGMVDQALGSTDEVWLPDVVAMAARQNDLRMMVQHSVFTIHSNGVDMQHLPFSKPVLLQ